MANKKLNKNYRIAIIGAGKIAFSLTDSLIKSGFNITSIISKNILSAMKLASLYKIKVYSNKLQDIPLDTNIFLISVPDEQIKNIDTKLSKLNFNFRESIFVHFSGSLNSSIMNRIKENNGITASFHIMQTFPSKKIIPLAGSFAAVETDNKESKDTLFFIAKSMNLIPFSVQKDKKMLYHLSGVYASNFFVGNIFISEELFKMSGIKGIKYDDLILPILNSTYRNIKNNGALKSLSGPIERGDFETIKNHITSIRNKKLKSNFVLLNYIVQSLSLLTLIKQRESRLTKSQVNIHKYLNSELNTLLAKK